MRALRSRRGGAVVIGACALGLGSGIAFGAEQYLDRAQVESPSPAPGSSVATRTPLIALTAAHADDPRSLHVLLDGVDRTAALRREGGERLALEAGTLAEGRHSVDVRFATGNVFSRSVQRSWTFAVDTVRPSLALAGPRDDRALGRHRVPFKGRTEPGATVQVSWRGGHASGVAGPTGLYRVATRLPEGRVLARVMARDRAGNATVAMRRLLVDTSAPQLVVAKAGPQLGVTHTDAPLLYGKVPNDDPANLVFGGRLNGRPIRAVRAVGIQVESSTEAQNAAIVTTEGHKFTLSLGALPQGLNRITVWVRDPAGNVARRTRRVMVDTTDEFGTKEMVTGARGADVTQLQRILRQKHLLRHRPRGVYDARTRRAVLRYQRRHHLGRNGLVTRPVLDALVGRLVVTLSAFHVQLIRDGRVVRTYPVAVGQPAFPTPTGDYHIVNKEKDPTWRPPPNSSWAKGLGPIPPGAGNPLGTRWMGTSAPFVGIHGTPDDSSIGTRASHGCIRMHIHDAEALYDQVVVGMPVEIKA